MFVAVFSDLHLRGPEDPTQGRFLRTLRDLQADRVVLLGDIFEHWWHFGNEPFAAYAPVVEALRPFRLSFVPGNHDFHAASFFASELKAEVGAHLRQQWDGRAVELLHGDHVDRSFGYTATSRILRGGPFRAMVTALGPARAWSFLASLAGTPGGRPSPVLVAAQIEDARARLAVGTNMVMMGHTHAPGIHGLPRGCFVNVGDGHVHHTWVSVRHGVPCMQMLSP